LEEKIIRGTRKYKKILRKKEKGRGKIKGNWS
jgi:hypothetical protein